MFDRDQWNEVFQVLGKNPLRTVATAFGVTWGIMMLIIMMGSGKGLQNGVIAKFTRVSNCMFIWTQRTTKAYAGFGEGRSFEMRNADVQYLKDNLPEVDIVAPRLQLGGYDGTNTVVYGIRTAIYGVYGDTPDVDLIEHRPIDTGRFITWDDIDERRKVCVIGRQVYTDLFAKNEDPLGKYVAIQGVNFQVVGVYSSKATGEGFDEAVKNIIIPISAFQKAFNVGDAVGWLSITSKPGFSVIDLESKVVEQLKIRHKIHPDDNRAFGYYNMEKEFRQMNGIFIGIEWLSWFVGILTLIAGIIGVSNIMLVIIKERTNEIGVRKAMGATPWNIVSQVMLESLFLSAIAGFVGVIAGVWLLELVAGFVDGSDGAFRNPGVDISVILIALSILCVSGLLSGILPASRAARIKPVEALRAE